MPETSLLSRWRSIRLAVSFIVPMALFVAGTDLTDVHAQVAQGFAQPYSPFVSMPWVQGEVRATPVWIGVTGGKNTIPSQGKSWGLLHTFKMTQYSLFLDVMARLQLGPVSLRVHGEQRDFVGTTTWGNIKREPRFEFSGCRVGMDVDVFCRYGVRAGAGLDYYWYNPIFTESVVTPGRLAPYRDDGQVLIGVLPGKKIVGEYPMTWGIYVSATVPREFYGWWPVFEARASWPLTIFSPPEVTDLNIAAGIRGPGTILGNLAVRAGYRRTSVQFQALQAYGETAAAAVPVDTKFDAIFSGWFGELVYYY